jgi:eukaryotic-like serine/threonine-protein kinase
MSEFLDRLAAVLASRYELERQLGEGGMATVYLARDLRHGRRVAIKVLRPELAVRLGSERFLQEIKVTANLQHPNILPLYDSGAAEEFLYYVMPYVEGESLRAKLDHDRQLSLEETLAIAKAVAAALGYAHEQGIVHRDIKPENVLLQRGQPLVADFGIALAVSAAGGGGHRLTNAGVSLGTPSYMSPEQASGDRTVDARSDIYSLGALTYEMLTGDPPHQASTVSGLVAKILSERPSPISRSRELVPVNVDAAVQRALAKSPADRFARAADFADALTNPAFRLPVTGELTAPAPPARVSRPLMLTGGLALLALGLMAGWAIGKGTAPPAKPGEAQAAIFHLPLDSGAAIPGYPAVSPDGAALIYPAGDAGSNRLFLRRLRDPTPTPIQGTEGANSAFISPDGAWVGFLADQSLKKVRLEDGAEGIIAPYVEGMAGATWGEADTILFSGLPRGSLFLVPAKGGTPAPLVIARQALDSGFYFPQYLPGNRAIVFNTQSTGGQLGVLDLATGQRKTFGRGLRPSYLESGQLVFANPDGRLVSQGFDLDRMELFGEPSVLPEDLGVGRGRAFYSVSRGGTLAIIRSAGTTLDLSLYDRAGKQSVLLRNASWAPRFSPDGNLISYGDGNPDDLWIYDLRTETRRRFTLEGASSNDPAWSPDGTLIAFSADRPSRKDLLVRASDGTGTERQLVVREGLQWPSDWSGTGYLIYTDVPLDEDRDIWAVKADGSEPPFPYLDTPFLERGGDVSPDGRWIVYDSNAPGRFEVFVNSFPRPSAAPLLVSKAGGRNPRWGPDGKELFYWVEDRLLSVRLDLSGRPRVLSSSPVLKAPYASGDHPNYDVHPDGKRFVIVTGRARPQRITVAINPFPAIPRR